MIGSLILSLVLFQNCSAGNDLFEKTKMRFDAERTRGTMSAESAQGYLQQFRSVVDLCPGNAAGWYYAGLAATTANDARANFYRNQADMHGYVAVEAVEVATAKTYLDLDVRLVEGTKDGVLREGEPFQLIATLVNSSKNPVPGIRLRVGGLSAVRDAVGEEHYVGDIAAGGRRVVELSGKVLAVAEETGAIRVEVTPETAVRAPVTIAGITVAPLVDINRLPREAKSDPSAYALVIGIGSYRSRDVPAVEFALNDAELMAEYFRTVVGIPSGNIRKLLNQNATRTDLDIALKEWLPQRVRAGGRVFVYFAGHGTPLIGPDGAAFQNLVPYDVSPESASSFYRLSDLYDSLGKLRGVSSYVFLDTCFSGTGRSYTLPNTRAVVITGPSTPVAPETGTPGEGIVVFSASQLQEPSNDFAAVRHGLFSYFVFRGLHGEADANRDKSITVQELFSFLSEAVPQAALRSINRQQNPTLTPPLAALGGRAGNVLGTAN